MKKLFFIIILISISTQVLNAQGNKEKETEKKRDFRIMFYNVENLFDIYNDSTKRDDEFTDEGTRHWNSRKYKAKLNNIAKVTIALGEWSPPEVIGVCEIENYYVLEGITKYSPLKRIGYEIIHHESPDRRGIDVALLYRPEKFTPITHQAIAINFPGNPDHKTRDILHVSGKTNSGDTLNIFVNHWPSRWGGQLESEGYRTFVASVLRETVDSIFANDKTPNIVIVGDLNDYPDNISLTEVLNAKNKYTEAKSKELYNLAWYMQETKGLGTHKYQGEWGVLDQILISGDLLNSSNKIHTTIDDARVFQPSFLLEKDLNNIGYQPNRTYIGFKYHGGYSDHLPIFIDLFFGKD